MTDVEIVIKLVADLADLYPFGGSDDDIIAYVHGWRKGQRSVAITLGQLRAAKRAQQGLARRPAASSAADG